MSFQAIAWAFGQKLDDMAEKLVLITLAHCHNHENGKCFPSIQYIVNVTGGSRRTVVAKIDSLQNRGLIEVVPTYRDDGSQTTNAYRLHLTAGERLPSAPDPDYSKPFDATMGVCKKREGGVQQMHGGGATDAPGGANGHASPIDARASEQEGNREVERNTPIVPQGGIALGAATPRKRCSAKPKAEPSPKAIEMVRTFADVYASHFRSAYVPNARKDLPGAEVLVLAGITTEQVRARADAAMRSKGFNCRRATTLALLAELWNNIGGELQDGQRTDHQQSSEAAWGKTLELPMLRPTIEVKKL